MRTPPTAFTKTLAERGNKFLVTYNHGKTLYGTPSSEFSVPLGVQAGTSTQTRFALSEFRGPSNRASVSRGKGDRRRGG